MRFSLVLAFFLAACGGDRITVAAVRGAIGYTGVRLTTSSSTYTPINGRLPVDLTVYNGSSAPIWVDWCSSTLQRSNGSERWTNADQLFCLAIYGPGREVAPGDTLKNTIAWPETVAGQYRVTVGVHAAQSPFVTIHSPAFTIQ